MNSQNNSTQNNSKGIKIAQVVSTFPPYRGGMGNVAYFISDFLSREGYNVTVFTPSYSFLDEDYKSFFNVFHLTPQFRYGNAAVVTQLVFRCYNYDVIHLHYPFLGGVIPIILLKMLRGKKLKLIVQYHMDLVGTGFRRFVFSVYNKLFLRALIKVSDRVIVTTMDYAKESLVGPFLKKNPKKFVEIPNGVDIDIFTPKTKSLSLIRKYDLDGKKVILFVGALDSAHYFKGINYLIKAFEMLKDQSAKLIIVGEGNLKEVYRDLADSFGLSQRVIFTGYIPDEKLPDYYNLCDVFVLPSIDKSEAFGLVILEAMGCAKPVVASDLPGVRKVVGLKEFGVIVKPKDVERLSIEIGKLMDNAHRRVELGRRGRQNVEQNYSWKTIIKRLIELYQIKN